MLDAAGTVRCMWRNAVINRADPEQSVQTVPSDACQAREGVMTVVTIVTRHR